MRFVIFIMSLEFDRVFDAFFVEGMLNKTFYSNNDGFLHLVADNSTGTADTRVSFYGHDCFLLK